MKINAFMCNWPFKSDVVAENGASVFYKHILLATVGITSCKSKKFTYEISAYDTLEKSAGFLNIDFNQSSFWPINNLTM